MVVEPQTQKTPEEFVDEIKILLSSNVSKSIQLMTRANDLIKNTVQNASAQDVPSVTEPETLERWMNLNIAAYSVISDHTLSLLDKLITVAEGAMIGEIDSAVGTEKPVDIEISGERGQRSSAVFVVQHQYDQDIDVSFEASPLIADGASPLPSASIGFEPAFASLEPGNPTMITVHVDIGPDFIPGKTYVTTIHVMGYESKPLGLAINVLPTTEKKPRAQRTKTRTVKKSSVAKQPAARKKTAASKNEPGSKKATRGARGAKKGTAAGAKSKTGTKR